MGLWKNTMKSINEYQAFARTTAMYRDPLESAAARLTYCMFGLAGEVGEIAEKFKKKLRGGGNLEEFIGDDDIAKELGDVMWYLVSMADELGYNASDILQINVNKLKDRQARNVVHGEGDNR